MVTLCLLSISDRRERPGDPARPGLSGPGPFHYSTRRRDHVHLSIHRSHTTPRSRPRQRPDVDRLEERTLLASSSFNLSSLITTTNPGVAGYVFDGVTPGITPGVVGEVNKMAVPIGDVNGDGIADYAFTDASASPLGRSYTGAVYVVFGGRQNLAALDAADGTTDGVIHLSELLPRTAGMVPVALSSTGLPLCPSYSAHHRIAPLGAVGRRPWQCARPH